MEKKKLDLSQYYDLPNPGLRAYFQHTVAGNPDDYRPPFWKGKPREEVLSMWQKVFDTLGVKEKYPGLYDFEMEMKSKVGPMSIQLPLKDRLDSVKSYYTKLDSVPLTQEAIDATIKFFGKAGGLRLRSKENTVNNMRLSTNSGSPFFTKRRRVKDVSTQTQVKTTFILNQDEASIELSTPKGKFEAAATLGWRGQEGGINDDDVKQRVIWMFPFSVNIEELRLYQPAVEAMQKHKLIPAYVSMEEVDRRVTQLFDSRPSKDDVVICTDFSKFDQHFNADMQHAAHEILSALCTNDSEMVQWFKHVFDIKYYIPLICDENTIFTGHHGMGSGSGGTNFDECLAHKALQFEACQAVGTNLNPNSMAYGDDGILTAPGLSVEDVIRTYTSHGQEMNPDKQYVSTHDCVVLRRWHSTEYRQDDIMVGVYSTFRALGRLLAQERFYDPETWGPEQVTLRAWSILENCKYSPYFEEFVDFVIEGDKYKLGLDIPGFLSNIDKVVKKSIDQIPDFLGYTKTMQTKDAKDIGIKGWRIYQYLKSKA